MGLLLLLNIPYIQIQKLAEKDTNWKKNVVENKLNGTNKKKQKAIKDKECSRLMKKKMYFNKTKQEWCRTILDTIIFYITAFFVLLAIFSISAMIFLIPFFIDPAWSTLQADFDEAGTECKTVVALERKGKKSSQFA